MPYYDYICKNSECSKHELVQELSVPIKDRDLEACGGCKTKLIRLPSSINNKHHSWSSWTI